MTQSYETALLVSTGIVLTKPVADIEAMDRAALMAAWSDLFRSPVPKGLSRSFLRRFLAFEVQARRFGGLPKNLLADLEKRVDGKTDATPKPGGRLLREWNGTTHTIWAAAAPPGRRRRPASADPRSLLQRSAIEVPELDGSSIFA